MTEEETKIKEEKEKKVKELLEKIKNSPNHPIVSGAFGDMEECAGMVEMVIEPPEGGRFTKFYGCSYLFKGFPLKNIVEGMGVAKAMISIIPRRIIVPSFLLRTSLILLAILSKKRLIHYLRIYFDAIILNVVNKSGLPKSKYNKLTKEIMRTSETILEKKVRSIGENYGTLLAGRFMDGINKREECELVLDIVEFVCFFLEYDNAYRFRLQDGFFGELNKDNIRKFGVVYEIKRLVAIMVDREIDIKHKFSDISKIVIPLLVVNKELRNWTTEFLLELDLENMKLDEADWYFCLRRKGYRFGNKSLEERLEEKKKIDEEKGHIILQIKIEKPSNEEILAKKDLVIKSLEERIVQLELQVKALLQRDNPQQPITEKKPND